MRIVPRHELHAQKAADLERVIRIVDGTPERQGKSAGKQIGFRSGEGDRQRMRAIPVIAEAVGGTIPGTNPLDALIDAETRAERMSLAHAD